MFCLLSLKYGDLSLFIAMRIQYKAYKEQEITWQFFYELFESETIIIPLHLGAGSFQVMLRILQSLQGHAGSIFGKCTNCN